MLLLLLTGNCVYVCMYVYIYPKLWICVFVRAFLEQGTCAAPGTEAEREPSALANTERCCSTQLLTCRAHWHFGTCPSKRFTPLAPQIRLSCTWVTAGCSSCILSSLWGPRRAAQNRNKPRGLAFLVCWTWGTRRATAVPWLGWDGHGLAPPGALNSKHSRFSHGGTATIHLWLYYSAPSLLTLQMNIL